MTMTDTTTAASRRFAPDPTRQDVQYIRTGYAGRTVHITVELPGAVGPQVWLGIHYPPSRRYGESRNYRHLLDRSQAAALACKIMRLADDARRWIRADDWQETCNNGQSIRLATRPQSRHVGLTLDYGPRSFNVRLTIPQAAEVAAALMCASVRHDTI